MAIQQYKPTTPARRGMTSQDMSAITTRKPLKSLTKSKKQNAGRNNSGRITVRHRGGGVKRHYRLMNHNLPAGAVVTVEHIEYDPNRSARIARVKDQNGLYHYILADTSMTVGKVIKSGAEAPIEASNRMPLANIPVGTQIYAIELHPGKGAQIVRSAGTKAQLMAKEGEYAQVRLPSGEVRKFRLEATAAIGVVGKANKAKRRGDITAYHSIEFINVICAIFGAPFDTNNLFKRGGCTRCCHVTSKVPIIFQKIRIVILT